MLVAQVGLQYIGGSRGIMLGAKVGLCSSSRRIIRGSYCIILVAQVGLFWWLKWGYFGCSSSTLLLVALEEYFDGSEHHGYFGLLWNPSRGLGGSFCGIG
jgi:hypothetical protein